MKTLFLSRTGGTESHRGLSAVPVEHGYILLGVGVSSFMNACDLHVSAQTWQQHKREGFSAFEARRLEDSHPAEFDESREGWIVEVER